MLQPKQFYLDRILAHEKADEIIRGTGWNGSKGCSIGCTLNNYNHAEYEKVGLGPEWLARVQDTLFEGISQEKAKTWTSEIITAIPDHLHGDTANPVWDKFKGKFLIVVLKSALESFDHEKFPDVKKAIEGSIAIWQRDDIGSAKWKKDAAAYAAYAADAADAAAARAADAARAAYAAARAARAADAAARAARAADAAYAADAADAAAARAAKMDYFADEIIKILKVEKS